MRALAGIAGALAALAAAAAARGGLAPGAIDAGALRWQAEPSWLANPAPRSGHGAASGPAGVTLSVPTPTRGMKWSAALPAPVDIAYASFAVLRYRARGVSPTGHYTLCLMGPTRSGPEDYQPVINPSELIADGRWRTAVGDLSAARSKLTRVTRLAVEVQARGAPASLQIGSVALTAERPAAAPLEGCEVAPGARWGGFAPMALSGAPLPPGLAGEVTAEGVPFRLAASGAAGAPLPAMPVGRRVTEVCLLIEARFTGDDDAIHGPGRLRAIRDVDRFRLELRYADGTVDACLPTNLAANEPVALEGVQVVAAPCDARRVLREVALVSATRQASFRCYALTVRTAGAVRSAPRLSGLPAWRAPVRSHTRFAFAMEAGRVRVAGRQGSAVIALLPGPALTSLRYAAGRWETLAHSSALVRLTLDGREVPLSEWRLRSAPRRAPGLPARLIAAYAVGTVSVSVEIGPTPDGFSLAATVANADAAPHRAAIRLPDLSGCRLSATSGQTWYLYPRRGAAIDDRDCDYGDAYSGQFPLQFVDAFAPAVGRGVTVRTDLRTVSARRYLFGKAGGAVSLAVAWPERTLAPGETAAAGPGFVELTDGRPTAGLGRYRSAVAAWRRPIAPIKPWFREIFNFRQRFLHAMDPLIAGGKLDIQRAVEEARTEFGGLEYLHLFDWGNGPRGRSYGRPGDDAPWPQIPGGHEGLRSAMQAVRRQGIPVGLYIEGYLLEKNGPLGSARGGEWQIRDRTGAGVFFGDSTEMLICAAIPAWREIQAATYGETARLLQPDGMYIDEFGFAADWMNCYAANHGHPVPGLPLLAEPGLARGVRRALDAERPGVAIYTEETPVDVVGALQDGSFTYALNQAHAAVTRAPLNMTRFALPTFKTIEILYCDQPLGSWATGVKQVFFNGEAIWLEGPGRDWFAPAVRAAIRKCHALLRAHRAAFTSLKPMPLVETLAPGIYANAFPAADETVYTLFNTRPTTYRGPVLRLVLPPGARAHDAWLGRPAATARTARGVSLSTTLGPHDAGCIVVTHPRGRRGPGWRADRPRGAKP